MSLYPEREDPAGAESDPIPRVIRRFKGGIAGSRGSIPTRRGVGSGRRHCDQSLGLGLMRPVHALSGNWRARRCPREKETTERREFRESNLILRGGLAGFTVI